MALVRARDLALLAKLADTASVSARDGAIPDAPGVYAVYNADGALQYMGLSRKVAASVELHRQDLPEECATVKVRVVGSGSKEDLQEAWKEWMTEYMEQAGDVPPGNAPGEKKWTTRRKAAKPDIKLTAGKGIQDVTVPISDLIDMVVKSNRVVAFVKGTRNEPQCGFSFRMLNILNTLKADYEVVNVLDEVYNPGLRDAIKEYSAWPTIPQLYVDGEFVGGCDIAEEMLGNGELAKMLRKD